MQKKGKKREKKRGESESKKQNQEVVETSGRNKANWSRPARNSTVERFEAKSCRLKQKYSCEGGFFFFFFGEKNSYHCRGSKERERKKKKKKVPACEETLAVQETSTVMDVSDSAGE